MIRTFSLSNFKAFGAEQRVPLRPITLIFGANSSGKSSLLHALLLAHHASEVGSWDANHVKLAGDSVQLGGIANYLYKKEQNPEKAVTLTFDRALDPHFEPRCPLLAHASEIRVTLNISAVRGASVTSSGLQSCQVDVDGLRLFLLAPKTDGHMGINLWETDHPISRRMIARICHQAEVDPSQPELLALVRSLMVALHQQAVVRDFSFLPGEALFPAGTAAAEGSWNAMLLSSKATPETKLKMLLGTMFPATVEDMFADLRRLFAADLGQIEYLGPLRSYPSRILSNSEATDPNWRSGGGFAWKTVMNDEGVRFRVNAWLGQDCLNTKYSLEVRRLVDESTLRRALTKELARHDESLVQEVVSHEEQAASVSLAEEVGLTNLNVKAYLEANPCLRKELVGYAYDGFEGSGLFEDEKPEMRQSSLQDTAEDYVSNEAETAYWKEIREHFLENSPALSSAAASLCDSTRAAESMTERIASAPGVSQAELALVDLRTNTSVTHRDVGIGISQVLPVLVHAYASQKKLITIEQPEIHLHPALQAELGDLFIESALGPNQNQFLLETHSEHLILRLLRRVRETTDGELEDGKRGLRPSDLSILFVEPAGDGSRVIELPVTPDGDFRVPWPGGFFAERANEIFGPSDKEDSA